MAAFSVVVLVFVVIGASAHDLRLRMRDRTVQVRTADCRKCRWNFIYVIYRKNLSSAADTTRTIVRIVGSARSWTTSILLTT